MKRYAILLSALLAAGLAGSAEASAADLSAAEVLSRMDANASFGSIRYSGRMEITLGGETRAKSMKAAAQGRSKAFVEFTNPEDRGTRYLKLGKDLWMFFPRERDTVKISGHLLKEGMMGSDLSYEDALESADYGARYSAEISGRDEVDGRPCYVVELRAKAPDAPYDRRVMRIDAERFVSLEEEMYAKSGKLLKVSRSLAIERIGGRWMPTRIELESKLRKGSKTTFAMEGIEIDPALDPRQFTMGALTK